MELVTEPDIYSPSIDENGNYVDKIPSFNIIKMGLICPCGCRKDKVYDTNQKNFSSHIKNKKKHSKWLETLNLNKANYYIECEKINKLVKSQKIMIGNFTKKN